MIYRFRGCQFVIYGRFTASGDGSSPFKGLKLMVNDSVIQHNFTFSPSTSIFIECDSEEQISYLVTHILEGGLALMPLDNYGFSKKIAWIQDHFGVSWQLSYN